VRSSKLEGIHVNTRWSAAAVLRTTFEAQQFDGRNVSVWQLLQNSRLMARLPRNAFKPDRLSIEAQFRVTDDIEAATQLVP
jgi:hypothetical protein